MGIDIEHLQCYPPTLSTSSVPPFSALDRFLTGQTHFMQLQTQTNNQNNKHSDTEFSEFSLPYVGDDGEDRYQFSNSWILPGLKYGDQEFTTLCDDPSFHGCISTTTTTTHELMCQSNSKTQQQHEYGASSVTKTSIRGRTSSSNLVKRKWTEEEDRILVKLVKENGMKKWASIAQKLDGRTAKQCRERWQNHLRPDIKKDSWSEEEEKIFVEAHEMLGNRWSEIARRIPGRTENAVKNHWNAAKRRRKLEKGRKKKGSETLPKGSSLLQEYITRNNLHGGIMISQESQHQIDANETIVGSPISEVTSLISDMVCDEELVFMLKLFNGTHHQPLGLQPPPLFSFDNRDRTSRGGFGEEPNHCPSVGNLYECHDHYLSYLVEGEPSQSINEEEQKMNIGDCEIGLNHMMGDDQGTKVDMDLIEMLSSSLAR